MATTQANHEPGLANAPSTAPPPPPSATSPTVPADLSQHNMPLGQEQVMALLKHLPLGMFRGIDPKDSSAVAAETLSNLSQTAAFQGHPGLAQAQQLAQHYATHLPHHPHVLGADPGPSSHPRGPPNLGQLSAAASAIQGGPQGQGQPQTPGTRLQDGEDGQENGSANGAASPGDDGDGDQGLDKSGSSGGKSSSGRRGGRSATMSNDEWTRQRKDNHKEVERRRRGNINEGINELGRIVPNGSGEKAKGAILSRAVQYIHHLKENEARNIEKWTLEKLLMDQAMGDLQAQLEETRNAWNEERIARQRLESELDVLRGGHGQTQTAGTNPAGPAKPSTSESTQENGTVKESAKREREEDPKEGGGSGEDKAVEERAKRPRVD